MINTYPMQQANRTCHPVILSSCLLLCLLLAACGGAAANNTQTASSNQETAIDSFLADAPVAVKKASVPPQTQVPMTTTSTIPLPEINPLAVVGDMTISGSSTVVDLTNQLYVRFVAAGYAGFIKLAELSTSDGFQAFCRGTTDSVAATRPSRSRVCASLSSSLVDRTRCVLV